MADMQKQFDLMLKLRDLSAGDHRTVLEIQDLRTQLEALTERIASEENNKDVVAAAEALVKKITGIENELFQPKGKIDEDLINYPTELSGKIAYLEYAVDSSDAAPTAQDVEMYGIYQKQLAAIDAQWNEVLKSDLPALNKMMGKRKIPAIAPAPVEE